VPRWIYTHKRPRRAGHDKIPLTRPGVFVVDGHHPVVRAGAVPAKGLGHGSSGGVAHVGPVVVAGPAGGKVGIAPVRGVAHGSFAGPTTARVGPAIGAAHGVGQRALIAPHAPPTPPVGTVRQAKANKGLWRILAKRRAERFKLLHPELERAPPSPEQRTEQSPKGRVSSPGALRGRIVGGGE
jgi:hypothetical protein